MNMAKMSPEDKFNICRKYYLGGFAFLPWLWLLNFLWYFNEIRKTDCDTRIRRMVIISGIGAVVWIVGLAIWTSSFLKYRVMWGVMGDDLTMNIPKGRA